MLRGWYLPVFFGSGKRPERWQKLGWDILCDELPRQVFADGVDFEASVPYHRLVLELFLLPALYRQACGLTVPDFYKERIIAMAQFTASYSRPDGSVPLWGDADDARALPFGSQQINDHRYLMGIVGAAFNVKDLRDYFSGIRGEIFWLLGPEAARALTPGEMRSKSPASQAFPHGGFFIMRNEVDHVFIDCGPVGTAGRGGHGHNDCLSFEAVLEGVHLITDCGAYLYTASYKERNNFRSTAYHNSPQVDGEEINRFVSKDYLWTLHNDALPEVRRWETGEQLDIFCGAHSGYRRLKGSLTPVRTIVLDHRHRALLIHDKFEGDGLHTITIPIHLAPGVVVRHVSAGHIILGTSQKKFSLSWIGAPEWEFRKDKGRVSPSYGLSLQITRLCWQRKGPLDSPFAVCILPEEAAITDPNEYASNLVEHYCR